MKIYDCFMFFDEEMLLDLRLNIMDKYVDKFVITESTYMHSGKPKNLIFDINKYKKFESKIIYKVVDTIPPDLEKIEEADRDVKDTRGQKLVNNSSKREHYQRDMAFEVLKTANAEDIILINDIDEIPDLSKINFDKIEEKIIMFKQKVFFYKFNLFYKELDWYGTKACKKKYLKSPQWLREIKDKKYSPFRLDTYFSKKKYSSIFHINDGGWHFSNIKSAEDIEKKLLNYLHHQEFEHSGLNLNDIKKMIKDKKILYDHSVDRTQNKIISNKTLEKVDVSHLPIFLKENYKKYSDWFET